MRALPVKSVYALLDFFHNFFYSRKTSSFQTLKFYVNTLGSVRGIYATEPGLIAKYTKEVWLNVHASGVPAQTST